MRASIYSEINRLKSIIIHYPGYEHYFMTPDNLIEFITNDNQIIHNPNYLLFDDLISPYKAKDEHNQLRWIIESFIGKDNCFEFIDLLKDVLKNIKYKKGLIDECLKLENNNNQANFSNEQIQELYSMDIDELLFVLLTGRQKSNIQKIYFKHPIPNLIFTRDIAAIIGSTALLTWGHHNVRKRENILTKYIFYHHPLFKQINKYNFHEEHPDLSVEGGDIIILNSETICIGISERTSSDTVNALLPLFYKERFKRIYAIDLPKNRSMMHLDTIFNRISHKHVVVFPPIFMNNNKMLIYKINKGENLNTAQTIRGDFLSILESDGIKLNPIKCGGDQEINQVREQWTDGANYFTISPGIIIGYECNYYTISALKESGFTCIQSDEFLSNPKKYKNKSKLLISIPSSEISRGRGGTRCLTLPLLRSNNDET
tara:strand:+ start:2376 stop:3665 length:1290 start_codon:yes stop_codon:yes gene_type:complete